MEKMERESRDKITTPEERVVPEIMDLAAREERADRRAEREATGWNGIRCTDRVVVAVAPQTSAALVETVVCMVPEVGVKAVTERRVSL